ncbi:MAG: hypothetical protein DMG23_01960 [Acidobacteria bacterium]|nr:MAG: hypothetical protein DMG23_01960 [Acidobacteriota bacterium]
MEGRKIRLLVTVLLVLASMGCGAGSSPFRQGRKAELRKDYDTALVNYQKALQSEPDNALYVLHERVARTQGSFFHLKQGRRILSEGRQDDAAGEFQKAISIDPTNEAAAQELAKILAIQATARRAREKTLQEALRSREEAAAPGAVQLKPFPSEPMAHFRISADSRKVFETLVKLADINVAFTADFQPRPISVDLTNIKIEEALQVVVLQTKTFWKAVTPNTILIVQDTPNNRRDYEDEVLKTIYLWNPLQPADRTAITTALKQILGLQRIVDNPDSNAIIIRDTPARVAAAEKMIRELDRGKAEIIVEVAVVEADRNRIRDLGITLVPTSPLPSTAVGALGFNPTSKTTTSGVTIPTLPLNRLGRLSSADFSIVLPGAVANALLNDSHTRILQNPTARVTDGFTVKLRIGSRYPYATGSFLPSFGGGLAGGTAGGGPGSSFPTLLSSTQFNYQDVGVNLDLTPHLLSNGEVALHALIEISSVGQTVTIGGLQEPSFGQRRIEHDIRLKEGEVNLLGGLIESTTIRSVSGLPGFSQIPGLRYFFSNEHSERIDTEVLVMLTPRVIRLPEPSIASERSTPLSGGSPIQEFIPQPEMPPQPPGQIQ